MTTLSNPFETQRATWQARLKPAASVMLGLLTTIVPVIAAYPLLPPFGLLMLLAWRLRRPDALRVWAPLPLGLFDDLLSGQPLGSAAMLWTICFLAIEVIDSRRTWRDFRQDWFIAAGAIAFCLAIGRWIASPIGAHVDTMVLLQIVISVMFYPLAARLCAWLDRKPAAA